MNEFGVRSTYSQCPIQLRMLDDQGLISTGTAFFYMSSNGVCLVTSWHNVSGKDPFTGDPLSQTRRLPTKLEAKFAQWVGEEGFIPIAYALALYEAGEPTWLEHPTLGSRCDVVAFRMEKPSSIPEFMHNYANRISSDKIPVLPGYPAFIVGYPSSLSTGWGLPIWKAGFIASEPHYDITWGGKVSAIGGMDGGTTVPAFFIDALSRSGMSGSPVFAQFNDMRDMKNPYERPDPNAPDFWGRADIALFGTARQFVGLYGGRAPAAEGEAGLGFVWKEKAIEDVCSGVAGQHPHVI